MKSICFPAQAGIQFCEAEQAKAYINANASMASPCGSQPALGNISKCEEGFILVMVLILIAFLALAMGTFSVWINQELTQVKTLKAQTNARVQAFSATQNILFMLSTLALSPRGLETKKLEKKPQDDDEEITYVSLNNTAYTYQDIQIQLQDEAGLIPINQANDAELRQIFLKFNIAENQIDSFKQKLKDYISPNPTGTQKSASGADTHDYAEANLPPPTFEKLRTPWEIKRIVEWHDQADFYKNDTLPLMLTTATSINSLNINTAPSNVLDLFPNITGPAKNFILEKRKSKKPYIKSMAEITEATGEKIPPTLKIGVFPSLTQRVTITSRRVPFKTLMSVTATPYDETTPWRINYEVELAATQPVVKNTESEEPTAEEPVFPDPQILFSKK